MGNNTGIIALMKNMTPEKRSEIAKKAALIGDKKRKEKKQIDTGIIDLEISYDIPMPKPNFGKNTYPFLEKMEVGGCVKLKDKGLFMRLYAIAGGYGKKNNKTFAGRTLDKNEGYGLWRIK